MQLSSDVLGLVLGQGGALVVLALWLIWTLREIRRLQRMCNRRTEDYLDLITEMSGIKIPQRRSQDREEDITNSGT